MLARGPRRHSRARRLAPPLAILAVAAAISAAPVLGATAEGHGRTRAPKAPEIALTTPAHPAGVPVTMPPAGLSFEYPTMALALGSGPCPPTQLVSALEELGSPPLALSGDSQDMTLPADAVSTPPSSWEAVIMYALPASFWSQLHCLLAGSHDPLTVGLNLKTGESSWASQLVAGAQSAATSGLAFSLGNEPDLYDLPNYAALAQPQPGEEAAQVGLYLQLATQLEQTTGGANVVGPELAAPSRWQQSLPHVISQLHLNLLGIHAYPLSTCESLRAATISGLLSSTTGSEPSRLAWVVADARAAGIPAIISEANSVSCGGAARVSDSPAAAVWAVRFVLSALKSGFHEVRFHFAGDPYDAFLVRGAQIIRRPLDSALVALNQWFPIGSTLRTLAGVRGLVATEVAEPSGQPLVILDNETQKAAQVVLRGTSSVRAQTLAASAVGLHTAELSSPRERIKLTVAPESVSAVSPAVTPTVSPTG